MASSTHVNYGAIDAKELNIEKDIISNQPSGYKATFRFSNNSGNRTYTLPAISADASVLMSESDLDASKLKIENLSPTSTIANLDELPFCDVDDSDAKKKITFQNFVNAVESNIHGSAAEANLRIADENGDFQNKALSADVSVDKDGACRIETANMTALTNLTLATGDMVVCGDVSDSGKSKKITVANLSTVVLGQRGAASEGGLQVSDGAGSYSEKVISGHASMDKDGVFSISDRPSATKSAEAGKFLHCNAARDIDNINELGCKNLTASDDVEATNATVSGEMRFGSNKWKMAQSGNHLQFLEYNGSSWVVKFQIQGSGQGS